MDRKARVTERNWAEYFEANPMRRIAIDWAKGIMPGEEKRAAFIASLQRFQVGESGEGCYLKKYAAQTGDAEYSRAIELFIAEENYHAEMLAQALRGMDAPLLQGHWSQRAFVVIRRFSGLQLELMILLMAELVAKRYYRVLQEGSTDGNLRLMCKQILRDENAHIAFHCDTLSRAFAHHSPVQRACTRFCWKVFYRFVCRLVAWDHRSFFAAVNVPVKDWMRDTDAIFEQAACSIFVPRKTMSMEVGYCVKEK